MKKQRKNSKKTRKNSEILSKNSNEYDRLEKNSKNKTEKDYYSTSVWKSISYDMRKEHEIC